MTTPEAKEISDDSTLLLAVYQKVLELEAKLTSLQAKMDEMKRELQYKRCYYPY